MLRKDIIPSCDTECTEGDCDVILIKNELFLIIMHYSSYVRIYFIHDLSKKAKSPHLAILLPILFHLRHHTPCFDEVLKIQGGGGDHSD